jgi:hypothetical protein
MGELGLTGRSEEDENLSDDPVGAINDCYALQH